jgi:hypothetical protein
MSDLDTAAPSAGEASSTLLTSQLAPLDLLVPPQQESAKSDRHFAEEKSHFTYYAYFSERFLQANLS